jgi:hypothetical protein
MSSSVSTKWLRRPSSGAERACAGRFLPLHLLRLGAAAFSRSSPVSLSMSAMTSPPLPEVSGRSSSAACRLPGRGRGTWLVCQRCVVSAGGLQASRGPGRGRSSPPRTRLTTEARGGSVWIVKRRAWMRVTLASPQGFGLVVPLLPRRRCPRRVEPGLARPSLPRRG